MKPHHAVLAVWFASLVSLFAFGFYEQFGAYLIKGAVSTSIIFAAWRYLDEPTDTSTNLGLIIAGVLAVRFAVIAGLLLWAVALPVTVYSIYKKVIV